MKNESKNLKSKYTLFTLIICVIAVLSGKPISEVVSDFSSPQETVAVEETYDYEANFEETDVAEEADTTKDSLPETETVAAGKSEEDEEIAFSEPEVEISDHTFRSKKLLNDHYKKHGLEMGFDTAEEYVENANRVISSPDVLYKLEEEDNDHVYYLEETNEFVVVSQDGYIRTYFNPSAGIDYFNRQ